MSWADVASLAVVAVTMLMAGVVVASFLGGGDE